MLPFKAEIIIIFLLDATELMKPNETNTEAITDNKFCLGICQLPIPEGRCSPLSVRKVIGYIPHDA